MATESSESSDKRIQHTPSPEGTNRLEKSEGNLPPEIQHDIEQAVAILKNGGCTAVFLFGSAVHGPFTNDSDIDLAVQGCPKKDFFTLYGQLMMELQRPVDLIDLDTEADPFVTYLKQRGTLQRVG
jgi:predicted nucleotidyltransferase